MMDQAEAVLEEKLPFTFRPDVLLSLEYFDAHRSRSQLEPEKKLMLAILADAVHCFQDNVSAETDRKRALFKEAEEWFREKDGDRVFSFESICDVFGMDAEYVRRGLSRWKQTSLRKRRDAQSWEKIMTEPLRQTG
jgi:hypothetical protein